MLKGKYPQIFENETVGSEAKNLFKEANALLDQIISNKSLPVYGKGLNQSANLLGPKHPQTIAIASKLAKVFENGGNYISAISLRNTISETMESILGTTHFLALKEYEMLSFAYRASGDIDSAFGVLDYVCGVYDSCPHTAVLEDTIIINTCQSPRYS